MARLWTSGFESQHWHSEGLSAQSAGTLTYDTTNVRYAGTRASAKYDSTATPALIYHTLTQATTNGRNYYFRANIRLSSAAGESNVPILSLQTAAHAAILQVRINASNQLQLYNSTGSATIGSASSALSATTWYRVEVGVSIVGSGSANCYAELKLDGVTVATSSVQSLGTTAIGEVLMGWVTAAAASHQIWLDDCCLNDNQTGGDQTSWPGEGKVWLILPTSDNARGAGWLCDNAATTNLWSALDNTPPVGVTHAPSTMAATAQIYDVTSGTGQNMDVNMQTYTAVGVPANDTLEVVQMAVEAGLAVGTTRAVNAYIVSNPAESAPSTFSITAAIAGTYPSNWMYQRRTLLYAPSVTRGTVPVARVSKEVNNVAAVDFCFAGITVESQTPTVALAVTIPGVGTLTPTASLSTVLSTTIAGVGTMQAAFGVLTLYGSNVADTTITTACDIAEFSGGAETSVTTTVTVGANPYVEIWSQGQATATDVTSIPTLPTGNGWVFSPGAGVFATGNWSAFATTSNNTGGSTAYTLRFFRLPLGVLANAVSIGSLTVTVTLSVGVKSLLTFAASSLSTATFADTDVLYIDAWAQYIPGSMFGGILQWWVSSSGSAGVANDMAVTTSFFTAGAGSGVSLAATMAGVGTFTPAPFTESTALSASPAGAGTLTPTLSAKTALTTTIAGVGTLAPGLISRTALSCTASGVGTLTGTLTTTGGPVALSATIAGVGTLTGTMQLATALSCTIAGVGTLTPGLISKTALSTTFTGVGTLALLKPPPPDGYGVFESTNPDLGSSVYNPRLSQIASMGCSLVLNDGVLNGSIAHMQDYVNAAASYGLKVIIPVQYSMSDTLANTIITAVKSLPGLWGYYIADEPPTADHALALARNSLVATADPAHPRMTVLGSTGGFVNPDLSTFTDTCSVIVQDYYPIGYLGGSFTVANTSTVASGVQGVATTAGIDSGLVLQSFNWLSTNTGIPGGWPSDAQMRDMTERALWNMTPRLILWWNYAYMLAPSPAPSDPTIVADLTWALAGSGVLFNATMAGASTLAPTLSLSSGVSLSATIAGVGTFTPAAFTEKTALTSSMVGVGTLAPTLAATVTLSATTIAGAGTLTATLQESTALTKTIAGIGTLTATFTLATSLTATISGSGTIAPTLSTGGALTATIAGVGLLSPTLVSKTALTGALAGVGTLAGTMAANTALATTISGVGTLTSTFTLKTALTSTISGVGTLTATLTASGQTALSVTMPGASTLSATLAVGVPLAVSMNGVSTLTGVMVARVALFVTCAGTSTLSGVITIPILSFLSTICITRDMQATAQTRDMFASCVTRDEQATAQTRS